MPATETGETLGRKTSRTQPNSLKNLQQPTRLLVSLDAKKCGTEGLKRQNIVNTQLLYAFQYILISLESLNLLVKASKERSQFMESYLRKLILDGN